MGLSSVTLHPATRIPRLAYHGHIVSRVKAMVDSYIVRVGDEVAGLVSRNTRCGGLCYRGEMVMCGAPFSQSKITILPEAKCLR